MRTAVLLSLVTVLFGMNAYADDGPMFLMGEGGNLKLAGEHPDIRLDSELIWIDGEKVWVIYSFVNESSQDLEVETVFPWKVEPPAEFDDGRLSEHLASHVGIEGPEWPLRCSKLRRSMKKATIEKTATITVDELESLDVTGFAAWQDGKAVKTDSIHLTVTATAWRHDGSYTRAELPGCTNLIAEKFLPSVKGVVKASHTLRFPAGKRSTLIETYSAYGDYIIGTGAGWKGPIGTLHVLMPDLTEHPRGHQMPSADFEARRVVLNAKAYELYSVSSYEPQQAALIRQGSLGTDWASVWPQGAAGSRQRLGAIGISSAKGPQATEGTTVLAWPPSTDPWKGVAPDIVNRHLHVEGDSYCRRFDFSAAQLLDGIPDSAWCTPIGALDDMDPIGFKLHHAVDGLEILAGFWKDRTSALSDSEACPTTADSSAGARWDRWFSGPVSALNWAAPLERANQAAGNFRDAPEGPVGPKSTVSEVMWKLFKDDWTNTHFEDLLWKSLGDARYTENARPTGLRLTGADAQTHDVALEDVREVHRLDLKLPAGAVELVITAVAQSEGSRDLCISEVRPIHTLPSGFDSLWDELQDHFKSQ
jgi:hypothetical protein